MSITVKFNVLTTDWLQPGEQYPLIALHHFGASSEVVAQCFERSVDNKLAIKSRKLPQRCWLRDNDPEAETTEKHVGSSDEPLRYTTAKQVAKLRMPEWVGPFDHAMMAYFKTLAKEAPETIVILELF